MATNEELTDKATAATPRPWVGRVGRNGILTVRGNASLYVVRPSGYLSDEDTAYIVAACNELPRLLDENAALLKELNTRTLQRDDTEHERALLLAQLAAKDRRIAELIEEKRAAHEAFEAKVKAGIWVRAAKEGD